MISLRVNGRDISTDVAPDTPLLWVIRDVLGLKGTKFGCGIGMCGACTVHLDSEATKSCQVPVGSVGERTVTTIEGLSEAGDHPIQRAWVDLQVPQCGYCQAGQIMAASALLDETPRPTDVDIDRAMAGNLCRCGSYQRIRAAIHRAAGV
ncbi:MAG: (2Fe-2S)-binding protein [Gemmatimonadales bacterium]|nr:MAG: (2Fe-2S)-binding protein [Gemmatimonadales bacterium]